MAQAGFTPIQLYRTTTASAVPTAGNLAAGELAINLTDKKLYAKDASNNVFLLADASSGGTTAANLAGGAAGSLPYQSGANATTFLGIGAANRVLTSSGTAPQWVTSLTGLTGVSSSSMTNTSLTSGRLVYSTTGGAQTDSANLTFNGTTLVANDFTDSSLTATRVTYAGAGGNLTDSANLTFDGTSLTLGGNPTLSAGTANGVLYLNGSKVATSGSALTFDGTRLAVNGGANGSQFSVKGTGAFIGFDTGAANDGRIEFAYNGTKIFEQEMTSASLMALKAVSGVSLSFGANNAEQMRLTSTGLGIGTNSPAYKLDVAGAANLGGNIQTISGSTFYNSTGDLYIRAGTSGALRLGSGGSNDRLYLDSSGNLGLGVTPSAWGTSAFQTKVASVWGFSNNAYVGCNYYFDGTDRRYIATAAASEYAQFNGQHTWYNAPSGTAGNAISFSQVMTLDASGNLLVGTTTNAGGTKLKSKVAAGTPGLEVTDEAQSDFIVTPLSGAVCRVGPSAGAMAFYSANNERVRIPAAGGMVVGTAALATTATDGFLYVPTCAGTPTGTPTTQTGTAPIVVDTTNNKLYFYSGGQWRDAGP